MLCVLYYRSYDYCDKVDKDMGSEDNKISLVLQTVYFILQELWLLCQSL